MSNVKKRIEWVDVAKGIAIILMVLGHTGITTSINRWIFSFHMPFFFLISGMMTKPKNIKDFFYGKYKSLIIPFFVYSFILLILMEIYYEGNYNIIKWFENGWGDMALWFVPVLFVALFVTNCFIGKYEWYFFLLLILTSFFLAYNKFLLPWKLSTVPIASVFIFIGYKFRHFVINYVINYSYGISILIIIGCFIITGYLSHFYTVDLAHNIILPIYSTLITSIAGFILIIIISQLLCKNSFICQIFSEIGKNTFAIMAFSQIFIMLINKYIYIYAVNVIFKYFLLIIILYLVINIKDYFVNLKH